VDCFSKDRTKEIATELGAEVIEHAWPGNQSAQYNWFIDNVEVNTEWVLRMDADEYLLPELVEEMKERIPLLPNDVTGIEFNRRHIFMDCWMKNGVYPIIFLRAYRKGCGRYEERLMDEHLSLLRGHSIHFDHDFCDHSLMTISEYCRKHVSYAEREAVELLDLEYNLSGKQEQGSAHKGNGQLGGQAESKHKLKKAYAKKPLFWRSFAYFIYRYFVKGSFLEGKAGFVFSFIQGWWYRTLVDVNIYEAKKACGEDKEKMKEYIKENWRIEF
jgi:glycosyltransferase involved in cell wall biosynthesis